MAQHPGNLSVLVSFDIIKSEDCPITQRQFRDGSLERDAIHNAHGSMIFGSPDNLNRHLPTLSQLLKTPLMLMEVHQDVVARHA
jgi:hypothetical protein